MNVSHLAWMTFQQQRSYSGMVILLGCQTGLKPAVLWPLHWYAFLSTSMSYCYHNSNTFSSGILVLLTGSLFEIRVPSITSSIECKTDSHFQLTGSKSEDNFILSGLYGRVKFVVWSALGYNMLLYGGSLALS